MRFVNLGLYLSLCLLLGTGAVLTWKLVPGSEGGRGLTIFGWDRHAFGDFHFWLGLVFVFLIAVHLALNWQWLKKIAAAARPWRLVVGLTAGVLLVGGLYCLPVDSDAGETSGEQFDRGSGDGPGYPGGRGPRDRR